MPRMMIQDVTKERGLEVIDRRDMNVDTNLVEALVIDDGWRPPACSRVLYPEAGGTGQRQRGRDGMVTDGVAYWATLGLTLPN